LKAWLLKITLQAVLYADGSVLVVSLAAVRCSVWGYSRPRAVDFTSDSCRTDVHITLDVGAISFAPRAPVAN